MQASASSTAGPDRVWSVLSDLTRWPQRLPTFTSVTPVSGDATGEPGARFEVRQPGLPPAVWEVTDWRPGRSFTWVSRSPGVTTTASHVIVGTGAGARLDFGLDWTGIAAPLLRLMLGRRAQRMIEVEARTFADLAAAGE